MALKLTVTELIAVVSNGGSVEVDAADYPGGLVAVAANLPSKGRLRIENSQTLSVQEMIAIAANKPGQVTFA